MSFSHKTFSGVAMRVITPGICQNIRATAVPITYRLRNLNFGQRNKIPIQRTEYVTTKIKETRFTASRTLKNRPYCGKNVSHQNNQKGRGTLWGTWDATGRDAE